jgi:hypothetical protein
MVLNQTTRVLNMIKQLNLMKKKQNKMIKPLKIKGRIWIYIVTFAIVMATQSLNVSRRWKA